MPSSTRWICRVLRINSVTTLQQSSSSCKISHHFLDRRHSCWHGFRTHTLNHCFKQLKSLVQIINLIRFINSSRTTVVAVDTAFATISSTSSALTPTATPTGLLWVAGVLSVVFCIFLDIAANSFYFVQKVDTYFVYSYNIICTIFNNLRRTLFMPNRIILIIPRIQSYPAIQQVCNLALTFGKWAACRVVIDIFQKYRRYLISMLALKVSSIPISILCRKSIDIEIDTFIAITL